MTATEQYGIWVLAGTPQQNQIVREAIDACDFPFDLLVPEIQRQQRRDYIRVEWEDLSRYGASEARTAGEHAHEHTDEHAEEEKSNPDFSHTHVERDGDLAHGIAFRNAVLGLAWYSLKVTLDTGMINNPMLAKEVFLAEGAHMLDFAYMSDLHRVGVYNAFHSVEEDLPEAIDSIEDGVDYGHGHGWFDVGGYYSWAGEAFMGGFIKAYAPTIPVTITFEHPADLDVGLEIRHVLTPGIDSEVEPEAPEDDAANPPREPDGGDDSSTGSAHYFGIRKSKVYHDSHRGVRRDVEFASVEEAEAQGRRPCGTCKPRRADV